MKLLVVLGAFCDTDKRAHPLKFPSALGFADLISVLTGLGCCIRLRLERASVSCIDHLLGLFFVLRTRARVSGRSYDTRESEQQHEWLGHAIIFFLREGRLGRL